jgi:glyoxylase-like metal-dependent hydrolase (beta-lactamase superfamily II)/rhodanese-related sulfurtransferase
MENEPKLLKNNDILSINADELKSKLDSNVPLLLFDLRDSKNFEKRHIPGSACAVCNEETKRNIMPKLPKDMEIVLVGEQLNGEKEEDGETAHIKQMAKMMRQIGLDAKYLKGGISAWKWQFNKSLDKDISPTELKKLIDSDKDREDLFLLDVRESDEFKQWHIDGSTNIPLGKLADKENLERIPKYKKIVTICPHGNRSTIGKYILERYGHDVSSLEGGLKAWSFSFEIASSEYNIDNTSKIRLVQFRRIGKGCMSYLLDSDGESVVIDPVYPIKVYLDKASKIGTKIIKIIDTHQHADHVSAAKSLAKETGAQYIQSSYENYSNEARSIYQVQDSDTISVGKINIKAIHTPGHTQGSISLLIDYQIDSLHNLDKFNGILFTGDILFVNGVGRPDLRDKVKDYSENFYDTLQQRLLVLPNNTMILPAHFDNDVTKHQMLYSTLGKIKEKSKFLNKQITKERFVQELSNNIMLTPPNYLQIIAINKGDKPNYPTTSDDIFELEMGPNRCSNRS